MNATLVLILAIGGVIAIGAITVLLIGRRSASTGALSRETKARDRANSGATASTSTELEPALVGAAATTSGEVATRGTTLPVRYEPIPEEEIGVTRRQVLNRGILTMIGVGAAAPFGLALLGFLWPTGKGGFGGEVVLDVSIKDALQQVADTKKPFYSPSARSYVVPYPADAIEKAKQIPQYKPPLIAGMQQGIVVLYQKCPHLGCKVPWCDSSQWFECPCHGSKYNRVGQKKGGPAPRGMSMFAPSTKGDRLVIDTSIQYDGAPDGTDTTGQGAEGPPCV
jgi:cytochrome b6-f complex iron-sulfur subunit